MTFKRLAPLTLAMMVTACGGGSSSSTAGITSDLTITVSSAAENDGLRFTNTEGVDITLHSAWLTWWSGSLNTDCNEAIFYSFRRSPLDWLIPAANAHAESTPFNWVQPQLLNLLKPNDYEIGRITPPVSDYCGITATFYPADEDTRSLAELPEMLGKTLLVAGTYIASDGTTRSFDVSSGSRWRERGLTLPAPVTLNADNTALDLSLQIQPEQWFDTVDMDALANGDASDQLLSNIRQSLQWAN